MNPYDTTTPSVPGEIDQTKQQVSSLERATPPPPADFDCQINAIAAGIPIAGAVTNPLRPLSTGTPIEVVIDLNHATGTEATFVLLRNDDAVFTATVPAGERSSGVTLIEDRTAFTPADLFRIKCTAPGDGWTMGTVSTRWKTGSTWVVSATLLFGDGGCTPTYIASGGGTTEGGAPTTPTVTGTETSWSGSGAGPYTIGIPTGASIGDTLFVIAHGTKDGFDFQPAISMAVTYDGGGSLGSLPDGGGVHVTNTLNPAGFVQRRLMVAPTIHVDGGQSVLRVNLVKADPDESPSLIGLAVVSVADAEHVFAIGGRTSDFESPDDHATVPDMPAEVAGGLWIEFAGSYNQDAPIYTLLADHGSPVINSTFSEPDEPAALTLGSDPTPGDVLWSTVGPNGFTLGAVTLLLVAAANYTTVDFAGASPGDIYALAVNAAATYAGTSLVEHGVLSSGEVGGGDVAIWQPDGGVYAWVAAGEPAPPTGTHLTVGTIAADSDTSPAASPWGLASSPPANPKLIGVSVFMRADATEDLTVDQPLAPSDGWTHRVSQARAQYDVNIATIQGTPEDPSWSGTVTPDRWDFFYADFFCDSDAGPVT